MNTLPYSKVSIHDPFWSHWTKTVREQALPHQFQMLQETGRIENFRRAARNEIGTFEGFCYNDSDVYKWLEAVAYALLHGASDELNAMANIAIGAIQSAQMEDGYIDTFIQVNHPTLRFRNLVSMHEMYCIGHLIEAGVAWKQCLDDGRLLTISRKAADHIASVFGPGKRLGYCGHEEIELALGRLSEVTGDRKYSDLAAWMLAMRGSRPSPFELELADPESMKLSPHAKRMMAPRGKYSGEYAQDHLPIQDHCGPVGHAVRAMYLYTAAAYLDYARYAKSLNDVWKILTERRMYVTAGIGPSAQNEGFTRDFDLPNKSAYSETCASIGLALWARALNSATLDASYVDVMETALYNAALAGISLDGKAYFYENPLESHTESERKPWFDCACCPPNIARTIGRIGDFAFGETDDTLFVNLLIGAQIEMANGAEFVIERTSEDFAQARIRCQKGGHAKLAIRIPAWSDNSEFDSSFEHEATFEGGYAVFDRAWSEGETIQITFDATPRWLEADHRVLDNAGRLTLRAGPFIYCLECEPDQAPPQFAKVDIEADVKTVKNSFPFVRSLEVQIDQEVADATDQLYQPAKSRNRLSTSATFIPYFLWNNRGPSNMQLWLNRRD